MKFRLILFVYLLFFGFTINAQTVNDVFNPNTKMTWLGLDFTATKLIGDREAWKNTEHVREVFESLNYLMEKEKDKYDVALTMDKPNTDYELRVTLSHNSKLTFDNLFSDDPYDHVLKESDIQQIVSKYDFKDLHGLGLLFNIETFNKPGEQSIIWITFVNMDTKKVLLTEKMTQQPMGFGLRNYWAGAIAKTLKDIKKTDYERWRKTYYRKA